MAEPLFALIDCNSFYCSCERLWRPDLQHAPIVVLSNNDGCVISRSSEARALGIPMGAPYFQIRQQLRREGVAVFSSNYALYGDMSQRVMSVLETLVPRLEVYSIDEAFADLSGLSDAAEALGRRLRAEVQLRTGIPVGVGIAATRTLAKLANYAAKRWQRQTGGVVDLRDPRRRERLLRAVAVGEVWGIGRRLGAQLQAMGIATAWELACADAASLRARFSVRIERTVRELRGQSCLDMADAAEPKREICCSRMFGRRLRELAPLREAVASYTARAAERLRAQHSLCRALRVSIRTGLFDPAEPRHAQGVLCPLPYPSDDLRLLTRTALAGLERLFRDGYAYSKAEVLLLDLCQRGQSTDDLFAERPPATAQRLMGVLDAINARWGSGTLQPARLSRQPAWAMRRELLSQSYTTRIDQLWRVRAG